jgi:transposase
MRSDAGPDRAARPEGCAVPVPYWLSDEQWRVIAPFLPTNQPGGPREDDRRILSGILHVVTSGCPWAACPSAYGPASTVYS